MGADIIQAQYEQLEALARNFGKQAEAQAALQKRIRARVERLRSTGWAGRGSEAFYSEMDARVFPAMKRLAAALGEAQKVTLQMCEIVRQAEAAAAEPFKPASQRGGINSETVVRQATLSDPAPDAEGDAFPLSPENVIKGLDDLLKPIDWVSKSKTASKAFDETLKEIGRILNAATGERGHVKLMSEFGDVLTGVTKTVSAASNLLDLHDFNRYFAGELTNQQIADTAIKVLVPIPILNDKIAAWMIANMPDPNGRWRGLVTPVE